MSVTSPTIPQIIQYGQASQVFASRDNSSFNAFRYGTVDQRLPLLLNLETDILDWMNTNDSSNSNLVSVGNYVLKLVGDYIIEAQATINQGGIIINPSTGQPYGLDYYRADFTIGASGSLMNAGDTFLTINLPNFLKNSIEVYPSGTNLSIGGDGFSISSITYSAASATITFSQAVQNGERYIITGLRTIAGASGGGSTSELPTQSGHEGEILFTDGTNTYWANAIIDYDSTNFEPDGITVNDTKLQHNKFDIFFNDINRFLTSSEYTRIVGGGFTINLAGFNANTNSYTLKTILKGLNS